jgi:hypothetical protein
MAKFIVFSLKIRINNCNNSKPKTIVTIILNNSAHKELNVLKMMKINHKKK